MFLIQLQTALERVGQKVPQRQREQTNPKVEQLMFINFILIFQTIPNIPVSIACMKIHKGITGIHNYFLKLHHSQTFTEYGKNAANFDKLLGAMVHALNKGYLLFIATTLIVVSD